MDNSSLQLTNTVDMSSKVVNFNGQGVKGVVDANTTASIDLKMLDDNFITGGMLSVKDAAFGDTVTLQVIDKDNILGYGANVVLRQFITNWYIMSDTQLQLNLDLSYPAKVLSGLYLRAVYTSTSESVSPVVVINYYLHKALL